MGQVRISVPKADRGTLSQGVAEGPRVVIQTESENQQAPSCSSASHIRMLKTPLAADSLPLSVIQVTVLLRD